MSSEVDVEAKQRSKGRPKLPTGEALERMHLYFRPDEVRAITREADARGHTSSPSQVVRELVRRWMNETEKEA